MKIAVVAANGREGQLVVKEAVERGHDVTAVVRGDNKSVATNVVVKDALDLIAADLAGFDAVVDAVGAWTEETLPAIPNTAKHLADVLAGTDVRTISVRFWRIGHPERKTHTLVVRFTRNGQLNR